MAKADTYEGLGRAAEVPRLRTGIDPTKLTLGAEEGFVLTRIDGVATLDQILQMSHLGNERTLAILRRLRVEGVIETSLSVCDLSPEQQDRVNDKHRKLHEVDLFELLEVRVDAPPKDLKRAYFALSKEFHPDRYFGRALGPYKIKLEEVFRELSQAFDYLSVEAQRAEYARQVGEARARKAEAERAAAPPAAAAAPRREREHPILPGEAIRSLADQQRLAARAQKHYETAMRQIRTGRWIAAIPDLRLATALAPHNDAYRNQLKAAQAELDRLAARSDVARAELELRAGRFQVAAELFERAGQLLGDKALLGRAADAWTRAGREDLAELVRSEMP